MKANELRQSFLDFFASKQHQIVPSAPMVIKNDPTLMFTNAGMNQFKELFLGNAEIKYSRIADSQKCLRVSGKHNDLEEVGHDTYHHTMFEMLGNWSFGDYFKKDAIDWAWEYLTNTLQLNKDDLYVTVFEGDKKDGTEFDQEAYDFWKQHVKEDKILKGNKKDNFWEMGDTGPCGPCSEIHIDLRSSEEKKQLPGRELVNKSHHLVIEIWNLVFMQFNRKANGDLELLPDKHVDTGMGFERLCMAVQGKQSNYDTDIFQPIIQQISKLANIPYGKNNKSDIAMRVIADHLRTISFSIADGQLPSNNKAGYVIRRILRRAVRYGYTFLNFTDPFIFKLLPVLIDSMGKAYPEIVSQKQLIEKVIQEEENSFLKTLDTGIKLLEKQIEKARIEKKSEIKGEEAFILYDTYGFPFDLTELILRENNMTVSKEVFDAELEKQKDRARQATSIKTDDWVNISEGDGYSFIGYDTTTATVSIIKYRKVVQKQKEMYQLVFNHTPFYAESGGQVGDTGFIEADGERINIIDTQKENNLIVHFTSNLPKNLQTDFIAQVNERNRKSTACNHSATHLMHYALQQVLGNHVEQKGSLVNQENFRFDFSHFQKMTSEEIIKVEAMVNDMIRKNISLNERRSVPIEQAKSLGAKALFGEKYGDNVRVIQFGDSIELCGGTHANATGELGYFKIISESAIAAGIRRIEGITSENAEKYIVKTLSTIENIKEILKNPSDIIKSVESILEENNSLKKKIEQFEREKTKTICSELITKIQKVNDLNFISQKLELENANLLRDISFLLKEKVDNLVLSLGCEIEGKANLSVYISQEVVEKKGLQAQNIIREAAKEIQGGGGGQSFFATAGGKNPKGINVALDKVRELIS